MQRFLLAILLIAQITVFGQKPSIIGFGINLVDFSASFPKIGKLDPGFSVMYWKGISKKVDYSLRYNGLFSDYSKSRSGTSSYANEFEGALHVRPVNDEHVLSPFATAGIGIGEYQKDWAGYVPLGAGLQVNMLGEGYIFLQANYRVSLSSSRLDNNLFYSLGFTQSIGPSRRKVAEVKPLPPLPFVAELKDRDGDSVADSLDACPDAAGLPALQGCPDTDKDGIADKDDKCPELAGILKYNGCPVPDTDKDGINDEEDKCPDVAGTAKYYGCPVPDRDSDGINDEEDKCPDLAGISSNNGCPEVKEEVRKRAEYAAKHLYFATGSYKLLSKSFKGLNEIAALMNADKDIKLSIDGYTDNTGKPAKNLTLSENRAKSVKQYLLSKGIDDARITASGYGPLNPVADNKTSAGRAKNRRVVLGLKY